MILTFYGHSDCECDYVEILDLGVGAAGVCHELSRRPYVITHVLLRAAEGDLATEVDTDGGRGERTQEARFPVGHKPEAQQSWVYHLITHLLIHPLRHHRYQPLTHFIHVFL